MTIVGDRNGNGNGFHNLTMGLGSVQNPTILISPQIGCLKEKVSHEELRSSRDEEALVKLKQRMEVIGMRRKAKEEEKKKGN